MRARRESPNILPSRRFLKNLSSIVDRVQIGKP